MEENQNTETQETLNPQQGSGVSFPSLNPEPKKSSGPKTFLIIGILILVAILGFVIYKSATGKSGDETPDPTPFDNLTTSDVPSSLPTSTPTSTPVGTPKASIDKSKISIEIQNGTGVPGDAGYLQTQLKNLGYTNAKAGNASEQDATATTVTFSTKLDSTIVAEITQKLNSLYVTVNTKTSSSQTSDVLVVTGPRKGVATATPRATSTPIPTGTPKPTATP